MKILLVKPPLYASKRMLNFVSYGLPLGLLQIGGVLEEGGNEVTIVDCLIEDYARFENIDDEIVKIGLKWGTFQDILKKNNPDLIAVSNLFTSQADALFNTCRKSKEILSDVPLIVGGVHPTSAPLECIKEPFIDFVGVGEGERIMIDVARYLKGDLSKDRLFSVYYKEDNQPKFNGMYPPIDNLDILPLPAYHLVDLSKYFAASKCDATVGGGSHQRWASIITSRGCPYSCNFCSVGVVEGKSFRARSSAHVFKEIKFLYDDYGIKSFSFNDSNFTLDLTRAEQILDLIIENNLNISFMFPNGLRIDKLSQNFIKKIKRAGCEETTLAFEHGDEKFLNNVIKKKLDIKSVLKTVSWIAGEMIPMTGFFIFGMPGETKVIHEQNVSFIYKVAKMGVIPNISLAMPLPGTELERAALEKKFIEEPLSPRDYLIASNSKTLFKNLIFSEHDYHCIIRKVFLRAVLLVAIYHLRLFLKHPFVKSFWNSIASKRTLSIKLKKVASLVWPN